MNKTKQLIIVPIDSGLTKSDKEKLLRDGFRVVEMKNPQFARVVSPQGAELAADELGRIAMRAIYESEYNSKDGIKCKFFELFTKALWAKKAETPKAESK